MGVSEECQLARAICKALDAYAEADAVPCRGEQWGSVASRESAGRSDKRTLSFTTVRALSSVSENAIVARIGERNKSERRTTRRRFAPRPHRIQRRICYSKAVYAFLESVHACRQSFALLLLPGDVAPSSRLSADLKLESLRTWPMRVTSPLRRTRDIVLSVLARHDSDSSSVPLLSSFLRRFSGPHFTAACGEALEPLTMLNLRLLFHALGTRNAVPPLAHRDHPGPSRRDHMLSPSSFNDW